MKYLPGGRHFQLHTREEQNFRLFVAASPHVVGAKPSYFWLYFYDTDLMLPICGHRAFNY